MLGSSELVLNKNFEIFRYETSETRNYTWLYKPSRFEYSDLIAVWNGRPGPVGGHQSPGEKFSHFGLAEILKGHLRPLTDQMI